MIRQFKPNDLAHVMSIWLDANIRAHDFISTNYWHDNYDLVYELLPNATVYVYEEDEILGFIGLMENYIAGIFVSHNVQSTGIGKKLLDYAKSERNELSLQVYKKNSRAVNFYLREGFIVNCEQVCHSTGEAELVMRWEK